MLNEVIAHSTVMNNHIVLGSTYIYLVYLNNMFIHRFDTIAIF